MSVDLANVAKLRERFEEKKFTYEGVEAWSGRDLQGLLGYAMWQDFRNAMDRAIESCATAGRDPSRHFVPVDGKLVISPQGVFRDVPRNLEGTEGGRAK